MDSDPEVAGGADPRWKPWNPQHLAAAEARAKGPSPGVRDATRHAYLLSLRGDRAGAQAGLAAAKQRYPDSVGVHWSEGWIRRNLLDFEGALVAWQQVAQRAYAPELASADGARDRFQHWRPTEKKLLEEVIGLAYPLDTRNWLHPMPRARPRSTEASRSAWRKCARKRRKRRASNRRNDPRVPGARASGFTGYLRPVRAGQSHCDDRAGEGSPHGLVSLRDRVLRIVFAGLTDMPDRAISWLSGVLLAAASATSIALMATSAAPAQALQPAVAGPLKNAPSLLFCNGYESTPGCAASPGAGAASWVRLEQLSPATGDGRPVQFRAGWPLIFRASVAGGKMLGLGRMHGEQYFERLGYQFPEFGQGAAIVFENPDGIWSYSVPTAPFWPRDESVLPFYPDPGDITRYLDDVAGAPLSHDPALRFALRPQFGGPLPQFAYEPVNGLSTVLQVPVADGVQFGADDDFPGLVILSNVGVGIVMTPLADGWNPVLPRQGRNLAGFTTSVGYELSDVDGRTSVTAVMMVPRFLFSHLQLADPCVGAVTLDGDGNPVSCAEAAIQRVDGGPIEPETINDESRVELRAFVVEPVWSAALDRIEALDIVTDMNADGQVGAADAELMGWRVLSNEIVFNFRQIGTLLVGRARTYAPLDFCQPAARPDDPAPRLPAGASFDFDIDGNGYAAFDEVIVCPPGGSGVTQPPR